MEWAGFILTFVGVIGAITGEVMILTEAYRRGLVMFFCCLIIPVVWLVFVALNLKRTALPFALAIAGVVIAFYGRRLCGLEI